MSAEEPQLRQRKHSDRKEVIGDLRADAEVQLKRFIETNGHFSLVRNFHLADAFTVMNGFCGAQSLYMSARFLVTSHPRYMWYALWLPVAGALFDYLDGKIARWRRSSSMLGQELDSLADLVSFGVAPTVAAFALGMREPLDTLVMTVFVCAGIARLARYAARRGLSADWEAAKASDEEMLVNSLSMMLPFSPEEKQALLESPTLSDRREMLDGLLEFALRGGDDEETIQ